MEDGEEWDDRKSLGLKKTIIRRSAAESNVLREYLTRDEWYTTYHHYERWEDIFAKLGIDRAQNGHLWNFPLRYDGESNTSQYRLAPPEVHGSLIIIRYL